MTLAVADFENVNGALQTLGAELDAAELHGTLCGLLCTQGPSSAARWASIVLPDTDSGDLLAGEAVTFLRVLYEHSSAELRDDLFSFELLLPDDSQASLAERVEALGHWCHGFMLGLAEGGVTDVAGLPDDVPELLEDLSEIARVAGFETEEDEQNESAYAELVEYVRVAVALCYQVLQHDGTTPQGVISTTH